MSRPEAIYGPFQTLSSHISMTDPLMENIPKGYQISEYYCVWKYPTGYIYI